MLVLSRGKLKTDASEILGHTGRHGRIPPESPQVCPGSLKPGRTQQNAPNNAVVLTGDGEFDGTEVLTCLINDTDGNLSAIPIRATWLYVDLTGTPLSQAAI